VATNYFQAAFIKLLGEDLFAWRASSAIAAALAIPPTYLLGRSLFSRQVGIVAAVLLFTSPYFLAFSRLGYNNAQAIAPVAWSLCFLHAGFGRRSPALVFLAGAVAGLGFYTYQAARIAVVIALALLAAGALTRWLTWRRAAACAGLLLLPVVLLALPLSLYLRATDPDSVTDKLLEGLYFELFYGKSEFPAEKLAGPIAPLRVGQRGAAVHFNPDAHVRLIGRGLLRTSLTFDDPEIVHKHFIPGSLGGPVGSVLLLIGFLTVLSRYRERGMQLLGLWAFIVVLLLSGLSAFPPQWTRMVPLLPAMSLLAAVGVVVLAAAAARVATLPALRLPLVVAIVLPLAAVGASGYFERARDVYASGMEDVIGFAAKDAPAASQFLWVYAFPLFADPPFLIREFPSRVDYASQGLSEFLEAPPAATGAPLTLFFDNAIGDAVVRRAREVYGPGEARLYIDGAGRVIGGSYTIAGR
jgi:4-amino-4-deoxy-L-arabinose transferase-like glycosyltransferase